jgi:hypothetical protein
LDYNRTVAEALNDPDINKEPKFLLKMSNSYYMSVQKYTGYLKSFMFKKRKFSKHFVDNNDNEGAGALNNGMRGADLGGGPGFDSTKIILNKNKADNGGNKNNALTAMAF